jgi:hypothetical protein
MAEEPPLPIATEIENLQAALEAALHMARELTADQLLARILRVFQTMPAEDRPVVIGALEREVKARKLSAATESMSGQSMVPNPHARVYLRTHESAFDRNVLERDEMMIATVRAMRAATLIPGVPEIYASWQDATREAMQHIDEATRTIVEQLVHEVLGFIADARAAESSTESPPPAGISQKDAQGS